MDDLAAIFREYNLIRRREARGTICHAPSVSLNFEQSGIATACCYNRRFILGRYPKQTIKEIWLGERTAELKQLLKRGDLSKGCQLCEHQLRARNFHGTLAKNYDVFVNEQEHIMPSLMEFELSNTCNLECVMCSGWFSSSIRRNREKLSPMPQIYDDSFVEQLREFIPSLKQAKFLGGEPFLNPIYYKIWDAMIEMNPTIEIDITTNATILNEKVRRVVETIHPAIVVSCDSLDKKTYESIRVNASFDRFFENLNYFIDQQPESRPVSLTVCPMTNNWQTLPDIMRFAQSKGINVHFNTVIWPPHLSIKTLSRTEIQTVFEGLKSYQSEWAAWPKQHWSNENNRNSYSSLLNQIELWMAEAPEKVAG